MIPVFRPSFGHEELEALREPFETGWIGMGPKTEQFEEEFARYVGADHAVAVNSGTAALHLALLASGIGPGDEVLVPTISFISTAHAVSYCGAKPVFVDVWPDTLNISLVDMMARMTDQTRAVIPVHYGGHTCKMIFIQRWAMNHGLKVIEDAAHACGSKYRGSRIGGLRSEATCFSFHAVKNLATGDGGMITTDDEGLARHLRRLRWCGIDKSTWDRTARAQTYGWQYEVAEVGYKCHMNDIAAAIGLVQLGKLDAANAKRRRIVARYNEAFEGLDWITRPVEGEHVESSCHNYVIKTDHRDDLHVYLKEHGVATGVHYMPLHLQPCYYDRRVELPVAEAVWARLLSLPIYPDLTDEEQEQIIRRVIEFGLIHTLAPLERHHLEAFLNPGNVPSVGSV